MSKGDSNKVKRAPMTGENRRANKALIERMDRLREKIGAIGVPVAKLNREGRRRSCPPQYAYKPFVVSYSKRIRCCYIDVIASD